MLIVLYYFGFSTSLESDSDELESLEELELLLSLLSEELELLDELDSSLVQFILLFSSESDPNNSFIISIGSSSKETEFGVVCFSVLELDA